MYTITKEFSFDAAHHLPHLPEDHKCRRPHGHSYRVVVELAAPDLNADSFVVDYGELAPLKTYIDRVLDHRDLNEILPMPTTAENLAKWLYDYAANLWDCVTAVSVSETPKTWATYRPVRKQA